MKKYLVMILCLGSAWTMKAQDTSDHLTFTALEYDAESSSYYFDVNIIGETLYTGYGADIQLPAGLEVDVDRGLPAVYMLDKEWIDASDVIYPKPQRGSYTHTVSSSFPTPADHTHFRVACFSSADALLTSSCGSLFRVFVSKTCTSAQWPIGEIKAYDVELNVDAETRFYPATVTQAIVMYEGTSTLPLTVTPSNHWSTCILPFDAELPTGVKAYTSTTSDAENIFLTPAASLAAYTPYILYSEAGYNGTVSGAVDAANCPTNGQVTAGNLNGAIVPQTVTDGFIMQKKNEVVKFYAINSGDSFLVPAGKCWMKLADSNVKALNFVVENSETAIEQVKDANNTNIIYDLTGRRLNTIKQGGLYIKNGEKFINK